MDDSWMVADTMYSRIIFSLAYQWKSNVIVEKEKEPKEETIRRTLSEILLKVLTTEARDKRRKEGWRKQRNTSLTYHPRH